MPSTPGLPRPTLRPVEPADLPALFEIESEPGGNAMAVVRPRTSEQFDQHWQRVLADPGVVARTIVVEGRVAGSISIFTLDGRPCVGYWLAEQHWGRGIATAALRLLLGEVSTRPLWARVAASNAASVRVLEKTGFVMHERMMSEETPRFPACEEVLMRLDGQTPDL